MSQTVNQKGKMSAHENLSEETSKRGLTINSQANVTCQENDSKHRQAYCKPFVMIQTGCRPHHQHGHYTETQWVNVEPSTVSPLFNISKTTYRESTKANQNQTRCTNDLNNAPNNKTRKHFKVQQGRVSCNVL